MISYFESMGTHESTSEVAGPVQLDARDEAHAQEGEEEARGREAHADEVLGAVTASWCTEKD
jgi:hypothetical protein